MQNVDIALIRQKITYMRKHLGELEHLVVELSDKNTCHSITDDVEKLLEHFGLSKPWLRSSIRDYQEERMIIAGLLAAKGYKNIAIAGAIYRSGGTVTAYKVQHNTYMRREGYAAKAKAAKNVIL